MTHLTILSSMRICGKRRSVKTGFFYALTRFALAIAMLPSPAVAGDPIVDIHTAADVEAKRAALVHYIWGTAWADVLTRKPAVQSPYAPVPADALPSVSNV